MENKAELTRNNDKFDIRVYLPPNIATVGPGHNNLHKSSCQDKKCARPSYKYAHQCFTVIIQKGTGESIFYSIYACLSP